MSDFILTAFEQTLLLLPLIFGLYLTYRLLKITDLAVEGFYVFGAAISSAVFETTGSLISALIAMIVGVVCIGLIISLIHRFYPGQELMVGILGNFMMYSVNLIVMGRPYIALYNQLSIFTENHKIILLIFSSIFILLSFYLLMRSSFGLKLRGVGSNNLLMKRLGHSIFLLRTSGLIITYLFASLSGLLTAQSYGFADIHMGSGIALTSLGAIIIGLNFSKKILSIINKAYDLKIDLTCCFLGCFFYFILMGLLLYLGLPASYLKLAIGAVLLLTLSKGGQHV